MKEKTEIRNGAIYQRYEYLYVYVDGSWYEWCYGIDKLLPLSTPYGGADDDEYVREGWKKNIFYVDDFVEYIRKHIEEQKHEGLL